MPRYSKKPRKDEGSQELHQITLRNCTNNCIKKCQKPRNLQETTRRSPQARRSPRIDDYRHITSYKRLKKEKLQENPKQDLWVKLNHIKLQEILKNHARSTMQGVKNLEEPPIESKILAKKEDMDQEG